MHDQVLVQLGDILDRGEGEIAILSLLKSLDIQAKANGGAVFQVCAMRLCMHVLFWMSSPVVSLKSEESAIFMLKYPPLIPQDFTESRNFNLVFHHTVFSKFSHFNHHRVHELLMALVLIFGSSTIQ